jgi:hypothetical protein
MDTSSNPVLKPEDAGKIRETVTRQYEEVRQGARDYTAKSMKMVRANPTEAALTGLGIGFLLAQLPLRFIAAGIVRLALASLRPAALIYAVYKLVEEYGNIQPRQQRTQAMSREQVQEPAPKGIPAL